MSATTVLLRLYVTELTKLNPVPWTEIDTWAHKARPLIQRHFAGDLPTFDDLVKDPGVSHLVSLFEALTPSGGSHGDPHAVAMSQIRAQRQDEESRKSYPARAADQLRQLSAMMEGVLRTAEASESVSPTGRLATLLVELRGLPPRPWAAIQAWAAKAKPIIIKAFPAYVADFDLHSKAPRWNSQIGAPPVGRGLDPYASWSDRDDERHFEATEDRANTLLAEAQKAKLVACVEGIISADEVEGVAQSPLPVSPAGPTHVHHGPSNFGNQTSTVIDRSNVGSVASGTGATATGTVTITGETPVTQKAFRSAISAIQASLLGIQDKLDAIDRDLYDDSSNLLRAIRKLQLAMGAVPETVVPASQVHAVVTDAFDEEVIAAIVAKMKPGALAKVAETLKDAAKLSSDPLVKFVAAMIATAAAAQYGG